MRKRCAWIAASVLCAGCTMFVARRPEPTTPPAAVEAAPIQTAAFRTEEPGKPPSPDHLRLASDCLEQGNESEAAGHLTAFVDNQPQNALIRAHLAELLFRLKRQTEAKQHFSTYFALAEEQGEPADRHLLLACTRLSEIAREQGDAYAEHLHRGIGLTLLARQAETQTNIGDDGPDPQQLNFKAIRELKKAAALRPDEARPHWRLHEAWTALGQQHAAARSLNQARERALLSDLTPGERQALALAK